MSDIIAVKAAYRLSEWGEVIQKQKESGLNVREFCRQNQIRESSYYYYLKKLRQKIWQEPKVVEIFPIEEKTDCKGIQILYHGAEIQVNSDENLLALLKVLKSL